MGNNIGTRDRQVITCPYCETTMPNSDDVKPFEEDLGVMSCASCGKRFHAERQVVITYDTLGDCELNGEKHEFEYRKFKGYGATGGAEFCQHCGTIKR